MRPGSKLARVVASIVFLATLVPAAPAAASGSSELSRNRREIAATREKLASAMRSDRDVLALLNAITARLDRERALLAAAQLRLTRIDLAMAAEQRRLADLNRQMRAQRQTISARARTLYIIGPTDDVDALVGATTLDQYVGRAGALDALATFDRRMLEDVAALRYEVELTRAALAAQRAQAADIRNEIAGRVESVAGYASVQQEAHNRLHGRITTLRQELAAEQAEQSRILSIIRSRGSVYTGGNGRMGFAWPIRGQITSPYGPRNGGFHTGIDIDCRTGDPIGASKAGQVIDAGWGGGYGNMIIVDHGNGYATLYAHMSRLYVGQGTTVAQHQKIGACGATGNATGDHLHFEIRINGEPVNPRPYLP